jgi:2-(1,2-epoxy-1,2-dihydrophenyl)acetyl-CoA isomerase
MGDRETLIVERRAGVAIVELHRPSCANAIDERMASELADVAAELDADVSVRAVVLTGRGRFFCAGGDVKAMAAFGADTRRRVKRVADDVHRAISGFARMRAPLVVAVNGVAAGGGFSLAMVGDLVFASASASFTTAYAAAGLSPDGSSTWFLPRLIGLRRTQELLFTEKRLGAAEAHAWNLVHAVTSDESLMAEAIGCAQRLAGGPAQSFASIKKLLNATFENGLETQMEMEGRLIAECAASPDGQEGIHAFCARRAARFGDDAGADLSDLKSLG